MNYLLFISFYLNFWIIEYGMFILDWNNASVAHPGASEAHKSRRPV